MVAFVFFRWRFYSAVLCYVVTVGVQSGFSEVSLECASPFFLPAVRSSVVIFRVIFICALLCDRECHPRGSS
jgi:hypothetical protein